MRLLIVGLAPSYVRVKEFKRLNPEWRLWTLNMGLYDGELEEHEVDALFEIHWPWMIRSKHTTYGSDGGYDAWLRRPHAFPIYMQEAMPEYPSSVKYPLRDVVINLFSNTWRGSRRAKFLTSTFSQMLGLALLMHDRGQKIEEIRLYGVEMTSNLQWSWQRPGAHRMFGHVEARGIKLWTPEDVALLDAPIYGYEETEMIPRKVLEGWKRFYEPKVALATANLNRIAALREAKAQEIARARQNGGSSENMEEDYIRLAGEYEQALVELGRYDGALQVTKKLIEKCDMMEVDPEMESQVLREPFEGYEEWLEGAETERQIAAMPDGLESEPPLG